MKRRESSHFEKPKQQDTRSVLGSFWYRNFCRPLYAGVLIPPSFYKLGLGLTTPNLFSRRTRVKPRAAFHFDTVQRPRLTSVKMPGYLDNQPRHSCTLNLVPVASSVVVMPYWERASLRAANVMMSFGASHS